jgi:hypothetical protein
METKNGFGLAVIAACCVAQVLDRSPAAADAPPPPREKCRPIVQDDFSGDRKFIDVSLVAKWGPNQKPVTALKIAEKADKEGLSFKALSLDETAAAFSKWDQDLHCATCFDYAFPPLDRAATTIRVEFDAVWDELERGAKGWGENNRLLVVLMHSYPEGGPKEGALAQLSPGHPFGRPAYHFRIRNTQGSLGAMMNYGGGWDDKDGAFEKYPKEEPRWWLPGFIASTQKGQAPGDEPSYDGRKDPYPKTPTIKTGSCVASETCWKHYTWIVMPERLELYHRASKAGPQENKLVFFMEIPRLPADPAQWDAVRKRMGEAHGLTGERELKQLPALYNWFPTVNAIRFYMRGPKVYFANIFAGTAAAAPGEAERK